MCMQVVEDLNMLHEVMDWNMLVVEEVCEVHTYYEQIDLKVHRVFLDVVDKEDEDS